MSTAGEPKTTALRDAAVRRLVELAAAGPLPAAQVALVAQGLGVSERTVWRWVAAATGSATPTRKRFVVTAEVRQRLAFWRGNVVAVHRELVDAAAAGGPEAPSLATLYRAVDRQLSPGDRAGLRKGEQAARARMTCSCSGRRRTATRRGSPITSRRRWRSTSMGGW